jgi:signal transduction histidine kinase
MYDGSAYNNATMKILNEMYFITMELINNILKHSGATQGYLTIQEIIKYSNHY